MKTTDLLPEGLFGKDLYKWMVENKALLINQKKSAIKEADVIGNVSMYVAADGALKMFDTVDKAIKEDTEEVIHRTSVINTTYWYDSHGDLHIDNLWKKSLQENKDHYLVESHKFDFRGIISDEVKAMTKTMSWRDLGLDIDGTTQALIFVSRIEKERNEYMFEQYKKGRVKNHSVGMRYVKMDLAINNEYWKEEFEVWNKYYDKIANKEDVDAAGYFWAITEAKVVEGSAVVKGSNIITPTIPNNKSTQETEPVKTTPEEEPQFNLMEAIKRTQFC